MQKKRNKVNIQLDLSSSDQQTAIFAKELLHKLTNAPAYLPLLHYLLRALMQFPKASKERLICAPSIILLPRFWNQNNFYY